MLHIVNSSFDIVYHEGRHRLKILITDSLLGLDLEIGDRTSRYLMYFEAFLAICLTVSFAEGERVLLCISMLFNLNLRDVDLYKWKRLSSRNLQ